MSGGVVTICIDSQSVRKSTQLNRQLTIKTKRSNGKIIMIKKLSLKIVKKSHSNWLVTC